MSDYLFMLESHLTPPQREVVAAVERAGAASEEQTFLVGGAMRDMLGGYPITDLDFAVQGNAVALAKKVANALQGEIVSTDSHFKTVELRFPTGVTAEIGATRTEKFGKTGARPKVSPAGIYEDLLRRDFTMNSIALSLHPASKGLLLDPCNGAADIELREVRTNSNYSFYEDASRMLRLIRFKVRLGFQVEERTQRHFENAREAGMLDRIAPRALFRELQGIAGEMLLSEVVAILAEEGLMSMFSPALKGSKLNLPALGKLEKARQMIPHGVNLNLEPLGLFLYFLTEKLTPKEKSELVKSLKMQKAEVELWQKLEARSRKLGRELKSAKLHRTSDLYERLISSPGDEILFLYLQSKERLVHDRIRNFLQKHLFTVLELTDREIATLSGIEPGEPTFDKVRKEIVTARLDGRKWTPPVVEEPESKKPKKRGRKAAKKQKAPAKAQKKAPKPVKKAPAEKAPAKKAPAKKAPAKKAPAKKAPAKKAPVKKKAARKAPARKTTKKAVKKKQP